MLSQCVQFPTVIQTVSSFNHLSPTLRIAFRDWKYLENQQQQMLGVSSMQYINKVFQILNSDLFLDKSLASFSEPGGNTPEKGRVLARLARRHA